MRLNLRIASRSSLSLLTVGGCERDGLVERLMFLAFKREQASERAFPREKREQGRVEAVEATQQKADQFLLIFLSQQKKKNASTASTFCRVSPLSFSGSTCFGCGWMVSCWLFTAEQMLWALHLANPCSAAHPNTSNGYCDQSLLAEAVLFQSRGKALHASGQ